MKKLLCHSERLAKSSTLRDEPSGLRLEENLPWFGKIPHGVYPRAKRRVRDDKRKNAFTLVEILVAMAIMAVVGTMLVVVFANTLRGSNKSQILAVIKQNGQAVLETVDKAIRNADNIACPVSYFPGNTIAVVQNGIYTRYRIALSNDGAGTAPSVCLGSDKNGCIIQDNPEKRIDDDTGQLQTDPVFISQVCSPADPMSSAAILTDTNTQSGVSVVPVKDSSGTDLPFFDKNSSPGYKDNIAIRFALKPGVAAPSILSSQIEPVSFKTAVGLR